MMMGRCSHMDVEYCDKCTYKCDFEEDADFLEGSTNVKGALVIEMPKGCCNCAFADVNGEKCMILKKTIPEQLYMRNENSGQIYRREERLKECPLFRVEDTNKGEEEGIWKVISQNRNYLIGCVIGNIIGYTLAGVILNIILHLWFVF